MPSQSKHKTVRVQIGSFEADIDAEIAPLIEEMWKAGIATMNSCQENEPEIVWLEFLTAIDAADFLDIVAGSYSDEPDSLYNRIRLEWETETGPVKGAWRYDLNPADMSVDQRLLGDGSIDEKQIGPPDFIFHVSIRFPCSDVTALVQRLEAFNEAQGVG